MNLAQGSRCRTRWPAKAFLLATVVVAATRIGRGDDLFLIEDALKKSPSPATPRVIVLPLSEFNALMDAHRFHEAEALAKEFVRREPDSLHAEEMLRKAQRALAVEARRAALERELDREITLHRAAPLMELLTRLAESAGLGVDIALGDLEEAGISTRRPAALNVDAVPLRDALDQLLGPLELAYELRGKSLRVTTRRILAESQRSCLECHKEKLPTASVWLNDLEKAKRLSKSSNRPLLLYASAEWSAPDRQLTKDVFDGDRAGPIHPAFVAVKLDAANRDNAALLGKYEIMAIPTVLVIGNDGDIVLRRTGYSPNQRVEYRSQLHRLGERLAAKAAAALQTTSPPSDGKEIPSRKGPPADGDQP